MSNNQLTQERLIQAIRMCDEPGVQVCLDLGADPNGLLWEIVEEHVQSETVVGLSQDIKAAGRSIRPTTPLKEVCQLEQECVAVLKKLFKAGANPYEVTLCNIATLKDVPSRMVKDYYTYEDYLQAMDAWYKAMFVDHRMVRPVVHQAIARGHTNLVRLFFEEAEKHGNAEKLLYRPGGAPKNSAGILDVAIPYPRMVKLCLKLGADPYRDFTARLDILVQTEYKESVRIIKRARLKENLKRLFRLSSEKTPKILELEEGPCILGRLEMVGKVYKLEHAGKFFDVTIPENLTSEVVNSNTAGLAKALYTDSGFVLLEFTKDLG